MMNNRNGNAAEKKSDALLPPRVPKESMNSANAATKIETKIIMNE